jgi:hypothetical protein
VFLACFQFFCALKGAECSIVSGGRQVNREVARFQMEGAITLKTTKCIIGMAVSLPDRCAQTGLIIHAGREASSINDSTFALFIVDL